MISPSILKKPVITEKATRLAKKSVYTIEVNPRVNKDQVAESLKQLYGVEISQVRITNRKGKVKKAGKKRTTVQKPDRKIAYITLHKGSLDFIPKE